MRIKRKQSRKKRRNYLQIKNKNNCFKIYLDKDENNGETFFIDENNK